MRAIPLGLAVQQRWRGCLRVHAPVKRNWLALAPRALYDMRLLVMLSVSRTTNRRNAYVVRHHVKLLTIFLLSTLASATAHELGHAIVGWSQGIGVVPTPMKEYVLRTELPWAVYRWIALGGVVASLVAAGLAGAWLLRKRSAEATALFAGVLLIPGAYSLRFLVAGRGHDGLEWLAAQSALGLAETGHGIDWLFVGVLVAGLILLASRRASDIRPRDALRTSGVVVIGIGFLMLCQTVNNAIFNHMFDEVTIRDVPAAAEQAARASHQ